MTTVPILRLTNQLKGNTLKAGDSSVLKYKLESPSHNLDLKNRNARIVLYIGRTIKFITNVEIQEDNIIEFKINANMPQGYYNIEVIAGNEYVFPSDTEEFIRIMESTQELIIDEAQKVGIDYLIQKTLEKINLDEAEKVSFIFNQAEAKNVWEIEHTLHKYPSVTVVDSAKTTVVGAEIKYISPTKLKLEFSEPFSGFAYLN